MIATELIEALLVEAAPRLDALRIDGDAAQGTWRVAVGAHEAFVELDETRQMLVFTVDVGAAPAGADAGPLHALMLRHATAWQATAGGRLGMAGSDDRFHLMRDVSLQALTPDRLADELSGFLSQADAWRQIVAAPPAAVESAMPALHGLPRA